MENIPYQLVQNPSQAQLLAMVKISIETLKDFEIMVMQPCNTENLQSLKMALPLSLLPFYQKNLEKRKEFDAWVLICQEKLDSL